MTVLVVRCLSTEIGKNGLIVQAVAMPNGVKADRVRVKFPCGFVFFANSTASWQPTMQVWGRDWAGVQPVLRARHYKVIKCEIILSPSKNLE